MNFFRPVPRPRPFRVLLQPCSPQVGEDQQPTSGAGHERHWTGQQGPMMHHASRGHADGASATVGMGLPEMPGGRTVDPTAVPVVPLPPVRPGHAVPVELDIRLVPRSAPVPSPEAKLGSLGRVANASALVSSGSRLPDEAGRLFTRQRPRSPGSGSGAPRPLRRGNAERRRSLRVFRSCED